MSIARPPLPELKLQFRAEFVGGGFTEPRNSHAHLGALLLGAQDAAGRLIHVGHMGGGFGRDVLRAMRERLDKIERRASRRDARAREQAALGHRRDRE